MTEIKENDPRFEAMIHDFWEVLRKHNADTGEGSRVCAFVIGLLVASTMRDSPNADRATEDIWRAARNTLQSSFETGYRAALAAHRMKGGGS